MRSEGLNQSAWNVSGKVPTAEEIEEFKKNLQVSMATVSILLTAEELNLYDCIAMGTNTVDAISSDLGVTKHGVSLLLDALSAMGIIYRIGETVSLTPLLNLYRKEGIQLPCKTIKENWSYWSQLLKVLETHAPVLSVDTQSVGEGLYCEGTSILYDVSSKAADVAADILGISTSPRGIRILDVGAGSAVWTIAMARRNLDSRITALDWPSVLNSTKAIVERFNLHSQYDYLSGDMFTLDWGSEEFDVVVLANICHLVGSARNQSLLGKAYRALRGSGRVVIIDVLRDDSVVSTLEVTVYAIDLLLRTSKGGVHPFSEYVAWLSTAGFSDVRRIQLPRTSEAVAMLIGTRSDRGGFHSGS